LQDLLFFQGQRFVEVLKKRSNAVEQTFCDAIKPNMMIKIIYNVTTWPGNIDQRKMIWRQSLLVSRPFINCKKSVEGFKVEMQQILRHVYRICKKLNPARKFMMI